MVRVLSMLVVIAIASAMAFPFAEAKGKESKGQKKPPKAEDVFKRLDKNSDSKLSPDEFKAYFKDPEKAKPIFEKVDTNRDGSIRLDELKAWMKKVTDREKRKSEKK